MEPEEKKAGQPLLLVLKGLVTALDPETGKQLWAWQSPHQVTRLLGHEGRVVVFEGRSLVGESRVVFLDAATGKVGATTALGFGVGAVLAKGEKLFLAGPKGAACLNRDGQVVWSVLCKFVSKGLLDIREQLTCKAASGETLWEQMAITTSDWPAGLALGDQVAQPDLEGSA